MKKILLLLERNIKRTVQKKDKLQIIFIKIPSMIFTNDFLKISLPFCYLLMVWLSRRGKVIRLIKRLFMIINMYMRHPTIININPFTCLKNCSRDYSYLDACKFLFYFIPLVSIYEKKKK